MFSSRTPLCYIHRAGIALTTIIFTKKLFHCATSYSQFSVNKLARLQISILILFEKIEKHFAGAKCISRDISCVIKRSTLFAHSINRGRALSILNLIYHLPTKRNYEYMLWNSDKIIEYLVLRLFCKND